MRSDNKKQAGKDVKGDKQNTKASGTSQEFDRLATEAESERNRKPGSQSNSSKQGNNGRGGGK